MRTRGTGARAGWERTRTYLVLRGIVGEPIQSASSGGDGGSEGRQVQSLDILGGSWGERALDQFTAETEAKESSSQAQGQAEL